MSMCGAEEINLNRFPPAAEHKFTSHRRGRTVYNERLPLPSCSFTRVSRRPERIGAAQWEDSPSVSASCVDYVMTAAAALCVTVGGEDYACTIRRPFSSTSPAAEIQIHSSPHLTAAVILNDFPPSLSLNHRHQRSEVNRHVTI
ncbi:hypothetical protein DPX16_3144 [Anabarilius grahami]|uniref:Uncharacterized protein n=1 Tax=Anabarilius grahami TaxID=495550 RepID=A0A3N0YYT3_ANAGA|nr:hypothetical protein DPX16_3144 [Anabarilius grahami]